VSNLFRLTRSSKSDNSSRPGSYYQAYEMIREITGVGEGNGPMISYHEGFTGLDQWDDFLPGADRIALDYHPYFAFAGGPIPAVDTFAQSACDRFSSTNIRYGIAVVVRAYCILSDRYLLLLSISLPSAGQRSE
jgi:hypothetical protein